MVNIFFENQGKCIDNSTDNSHFPKMVNFTNNGKRKAERFGQSQANEFWDALRIISFDKFSVVLFIIK